MFSCVLCFPARQFTDLELILPTALNHVAVKVVRQDGKIGRMMGLWDGARDLRSD